MNVDKKIASRETTSVRKVNGKGSMCGKPGITLIKTQIPNQATCTHTNVMLPQNLAITSATRSEAVRSSLAASSSCLTASIFRWVNLSTELAESVSKLCLDSDALLMVQTHVPNVGVTQWLRQKPPPGL